MKVLIFGSKGFIGQHFLSVYPTAITPSTDIADQVAVANILQSENPDVVINCAGKTGTPNVDWCEDHKMETLRSNVTGPLVLLEECLKRDVYLVHMSSGCMFTGDYDGNGFSEEHEPNFDGSYYSRTKAWADQILKEYPVLTLRIRMPFDGSIHPRNLLSKLKKYAEVLDTPNSITYIPDFLTASAALIDKRKTGIYNIVNPGTTSPYEVMEMYKKLVQPDHVFSKLEVKDLDKVVKAGRSNCSLNTQKLEDEGIALQPIQEAVECALQELKSAS